MNYIKVKQMLEVENMDFTVDEMIYLNKNAIYLPKMAFLNRMKLHLVSNFNMDIGDNDNDYHNDIVEFLKDLYAKVSVFSDEEWNELQLLLPFRDLPYTEYDTKEYNDFMVEIV